MLKHAKQIEQGKTQNKGTMITINLKAHQIEVDGIAKKSKIKNKKPCLCRL